jgi:hypothetical protein
MTFNIFGDATKEDIRVGYISTERGYISDITICAANSYAKANPGTVFIFQTRKETRYLNINEVNKLTPNDLDSDIETCPGVEMDAKCGPPQVIFRGGGGIGAQGNPIIGTDGAVLGVDVVHGGYGYQYPPQVEVKDPCGIGAGPVTEATLGEIIETVQTYEDEEDFEDYQICEDDRVGFGNQYDAEGKIIGAWDPGMYTNNAKNPFDKEVSDYQKQLQEFKNPWWTTRKELPSKITSPGKSTKTKYDVKDSRWGDFMNEYAISPVPPSNVKGSDFAGKTYSLEWDLEVPYDGEYIFRGAADNEGKLYIDNKQVSIYHHNYKGPAIKAKKKLTEGSHNIRLDLFNTVERQKVAEQNFTLSGGAVLELEEWTDGDWQDLVCYVDEGRFTNIVGGRCKFVVDASGEFPAGTQKEIDVRITSASEFINQIEIVDLFVVSGPEVDAVGNKIQLNKKFKQTVEVGKTYDVIVKTLVGNSPGAKLRTRSLPAKSLPIPTSTGSNFSKKNIFNTVEYIDKANRPLWRTNVYARGGFLNDNGVCPFDTSKLLEDNPYAGDHTIVWNSVEFPVDGQYLIEIEVDDNVDLKIGDQISIKKEGFKPGTSIGTGPYKQSHYIKKGVYPVTAVLNQIPGGQFGFDSTKGINPMALAINIATAYTEKEVDVQKSFNENPMGVSLIIEAPLPSIPQAPLPQQEGRCPPNPIWSTRFPNADQKWHPVNFKGWSKRLNKYAMSPIPPLSTPNSDGGGGVPYRNKWTMNAPYEGFYQLKAEVDDIAKISIDGEVKLDLNPSNPKGQKRKGEILFKLSEGNHEIEVEVENFRFEKFKLVDQEIFNTADWIVGTSSVSTTAGTQRIVYTGLKKAGDRRWVSDKRLEFDDNSEDGFDVNAAFTIDSGDAKFNKDGITLEGSGEVTLTYSWNDIPGYKSKALESLSIGDTTWTQLNVRRGSETHTIKLEGTTTTVGSSLNPGVKKKGVSYSGPAVASYRSGPLGPELTPVWKNAADYRANNMDKTWVMKWSNVNFPSTAQYTVHALADDVLKVRIDGVEVAEARVFQGIRTFSVQLNAGKKEVELELYNIPGDNTSTFRTNPTVAAVKITTGVQIGTGITKPWTVNPIGISAHIVPPPCPKKIEGKGVVTDVKVIAPGNGFNPPEGPGYPALLKLKNIDVEDPGINYNCAEDKVVIEPANGAELVICGCDSFGRINKICIEDPGSGWTEYPNVRIVSPTGINATLRPQFEIERDPLGVPPDQLVQVTDLVGVKQTGYYEGRPYYGAIFYKEGVKYAGYYETIGEPIQIYDTLQESIDAQVTTPPSAIQRQGTDISSNDPRLNIPGTPENLTDN